MSKNFVDTPLDVVRTMAQGIALPTFGSSARLSTSHTFTLTPAQREELIKSGVLRVFVGPRRAGRQARVFQVRASGLRGAELAVVKLSDAWLVASGGRIHHYTLPPVYLGALSASTPVAWVSDAVEPSLIGWWELRLQPHPRLWDGASIFSSLDFTYHYVPDF
jgi:hypothetical protein